MELDLYLYVKVPPCYPLDLKRGLRHLNDRLSICWMQLVSDFLHISAYFLSPIEHRKFHGPLVCLAFAILLFNHTMAVAIGEPHKLTCIVVT